MINQFSSSFSRNFKSSVISRNCYQFTVENVLSEENRKQTMEKMKKAPLMRMAKSKQDTYASVLIPICVSPDREISILFTRRSGNISRHVRQVSFPGGIKDETDASFEDCALRETEEEIGLPRSRVQLWGCGNLVRPPHTAAIMPVVGCIENFTTKDLQLNIDEVEEAFTLPLKNISSTTATRHTQFRAGYSAPVFVVGDYKVWGVTGAILQIFLSCFLPQSVFHNRIKYIAPYKKQ